MLFLKSLFNGIGTGAGVAWPLFGVTFGALGIAVGSIPSLALGGIAIGLFILVSVPIIYSSYKKMREFEELQHQESHRKEKKLITIIKAIGEDPQLFAALSKEKLLFLTRILPDIQHNTEISHHVREQIKNTYTVSVLNNLIAAFYGFTGTFGAIAGCSAGAAGLLSGLGLFSSFAVFPVIGWSILALAFSISLLAGISAFNETAETAKNDLWNQMIKSIYKDLKEKNNNLYTELHQQKTPTDSAPMHASPIFSAPNINDAFSSNNHSLTQPK